MNKRYVETDEERDQSGKLEKDAGRKLKDRQQHSQEGGPRQHGGWSEDDGQRKPAEDGDDEPNSQSGRTVDEP